MIENEEKSIFDLALELGVRTDTVLQAMREMGLPGDESSIFDRDQQETLIDQMVSSGAISSNLIKRNKRRKPTQQPFVDDEIFTEALGASENGYSQINIPKLPQIETGTPKKSFLQKWFGKKKNLVSSLKQNPLTEDAVESLFYIPIDTEEKLEQESVPDEEIELQERIDETFAEEIDDRNDETVGEEKIPDETGEIESFEQEEPISEDLQQELESLNIGEEKLDEDQLLDEDLLIDESLSEPLTNEEIEGIDEIDLDEDLLGEIENVDMGEPGGLETLAEEDLEDLENIDQLETSDLQPDEIEAIGEDEIDEAINLDETELEDFSSLPPQEISEERERLSNLENASFAEKIFSRIQLSPTEMWALMIGSMATMLVLLGFTVYWWIYVSPRAMNSVFEEAEKSYALATEDQIPEWQRDRIPWKKPRGTLQKTADLYSEYLKTVPDDHLKLKLAYKKLCDCYYRMAIGDKATGNKENSEIAFRQMATLYEKYLDLLEKIAEANIGETDQRQLAYPSVEDQQEALYRIALAKREADQFDQTIQNLEEFVNRYPDSDKTLEARIEIGNSYEEWAKSKKDQELSLLDNAIDAYNKSLQLIPETNPFLRMKLYSKIGDVHYRLFEQSMQKQKDDEANQHLSEVIADYIQGVSEAEKIDVERLDSINRRPVQSAIQNVKKKLGDLYLIRGAQSGKEWKNFEERAEPFPESIVYKQQLLESAKREQETTRHYLNLANELYDNLLAQSDLLGATEYQEILYNKAESFYIMREYPKTLAAGDELLSSTRELSDVTKTKTLYLLGNTAWEEAKTTDDYTKVKDYYYRALEQDPFYPAEEKGDTSHLADIRLINAYYLQKNNKNYPVAIKRYNDMVNRYPESGYTYITLFYYGKTLQDYGDQLMEQAEKLREEAALAKDGSAQIAQANRLEEQTKDIYDQAVTQYNKAINARETSKYVDTQNEQFLKQIMFNRGHSAFDGGKYQEAEKYYKEALDRYAKDNTAENYKPLAVERLGDLNARLTAYDPAIRYYNQYLENAYENPDMRITMKLADAYLKQFSWKEARDWYQKIINNDPMVSTDKQGDKQTTPEKPIQKSPGFIAMKKMAESYLGEAITAENRQDKMKKALDVFKVMAEKYPMGRGKEESQYPADTESIRTIGNIHFELAQFPQAVKSYDALLKMAPNYPRSGQIIYRIGQSLFNMEKYEEAIERLSQITEESMENPIQFADVLILLGQAYQNRANQFLQSGEEDLYTRYLEKAQRTYERVSLTKQPQKIKEANVMSSAIQSILKSRAELLTSKTP